MHEPNVWRERWTFRLWNVLPKSIRRRRIQAGLTSLGPDRVRFGMASLDGRAGRGYDECFLGRAFSETKWQGVERLAGGSFDMSAISIAHYRGDPMLREEVMMYLAEHGDAPEPTFKRRTKRHVGGFLR